MKQLTLDGDMQLNPDSMLYVCNRWDQVDESEDQRVFEEIRSRIRRNGIEVKEGQLLKLSIKKVLYNSLEDTRTVPKCNM